MSSITLGSAFNADNFWASLQGAPILQTGTTYRFQNTAGQFVEVTGSGLTYASGLPAGGNYTSIKVYPTNAYTGVPTGSYTSAANVVFATYFTSGAQAALADADQFTGSAGGDNFRGGLGTDSMSGGAGNDTFRFVVGDNVGAETINGGGDTDRIVVSGAGETYLSDDVITSIEQLEVQGGATAILSGGQIAGFAGLQVIGDGGADKIRISATATGENIDLSSWTFSNWQNYASEVLIQATSAIARNDVIIGSSIRDVINSEGGNDSVSAGAGDDFINGGAGNDTLLGGAGDDVYFVTDYSDTIIEFANEGIEDTVFSFVSYILPDHVEELLLFSEAGAADGLGNDGANELHGNEFRNGLAGGAGNDTIRGGGGDDAIDGGTGADSMLGGTGVDTYYVDNAGDVVVETEIGATLYDTVWTNLANYTLPDNVEIYIAIPNAGAMNGTGNDLTTLMLGNEGANILNSLGGNDFILGGAGNDTINSGAGGDPNGYEVISGGVGADSLTGGGGHDYFNYELITHGGDTIADFATNAGVDDDILDFRPMWATFTNTAGVSTVVQAVASGHLTFTQTGANTQVFADANGGTHGAGEQVLMATLLNTTAANVQTYSLI